MVNLLYETEKQGDSIYDVGLHRGEDTEFYLKKGFRVVAFEANPELVDACKSRFAEAIYEQRLVVVDGAVVEARDDESNSATVAFYRNDELSIWGTVNQDWAERNAHLGTSSTVIEVRAVNLTEVIRQYGVPYYMKIDIEGCDAVCLRALERFRLKPAFLSFESDKTSLRDIYDEISLLVRLGYDSFQAVEQSSISVSQTPPNPAREGRFAEHRFEHGSSGLFGAELPGRWRTASELRRQYLLIRLGYYLLGDAGLMVQWRFPGAGLIRRISRKIIASLTGAPVPGWYDTHARHSCYRS